MAVTETHPDEAVQERNRKPEKTVKKQASVWSVAVAAAVLLAFFVWEYKVNFGPPPVAPYSEKEKKNRAIIAEIIKRSHGEFSQVSEEDRKTLQQIAGGFAGLAYKDVKKTEKL